MTVKNDTKTFIQNLNVQILQWVIKRIINQQILFWQSKSPQSFANPFASFGFELHSGYKQALKYIDKITIILL